MRNKTKQQQKPVPGVKVGNEDRERKSKGHVERKRKERSDRINIFLLVSSFSVSASSGICIQDPNPQANCHGRFLREPDSGKVRQKSNAITTSLGLAPRPRLDSYWAGQLALKRSSLAQATGWKQNQTLLRLSSPHFPGSVAFQVEPLPSSRDRPSKLSAQPCEISLSTPGVHQTLAFDPGSSLRVECTCDCRRGREGGERTASPSL